MLDDKEKLLIWRNCKCCGDDVEVLNLIKYSDKMECREEFAFQYNSNKRIADVVLLEDGNINFIFEIFKTHRTDEINRPHDKWCEIDTEKFIISTMEQTNRNDSGEIEIECVRDILCIDCAKIKQLEFDKAEADRKKEESKNKLYKANCIKIQNCHKEATQREEWDALEFMKTLHYNELVRQIGKYPYTTLFSRWTSLYKLNKKREKRWEKERQAELLRGEEEYKIREEARRRKQRMEYADEAKAELAKSVKREEYLQSFALGFINMGQIKQFHRLAPSMLGDLHRLRREIKKELLLWFPINQRNGDIYKFFPRKCVSHKARANRVERMALYKERCK